MLNRVEGTEYSRVNTVVYTQKYPITVPMVGIGRMAKLNARCLPKLRQLHPQSMKRFNNEISNTGFKFSCSKMLRFKCYYIK